MRHLFVVVLAVLVLLFSALPASASEARVIGGAQCEFLGGSVSVPAGSQIVYRPGAWVARTRAFAARFANASTVTFTVDGAPIARPGSYWSAPEPLNDPRYGSVWIVRWSYLFEAPTVGVTRTFTWSAVTDHPMIDGILFQRPGAAVSEEEAFVGGFGDGRPWLIPAGYASATRTCAVTGTP